MSYQTLQDKVLRLYKGGAKRIVLSEIEARPSIGEAVGVGKYDSPASGNSQLTGPLTEVSRTTYKKMVEVPENATEVEIEVIASLIMRDARGIEYGFNFTQP